MDESKPEDKLKPDSSDRRTGRSRQSSECDSEPQANSDDVDLDADGRRPARTRKEHEEEQNIEGEYESDDDAVDEERVECRPYERKKAAGKPASRQYMMMGVGALVLLLLIIGVGSVSKAPSSSSNEQVTSGEENIDLSGSNVMDRMNTATPVTGTEQTAGNTQQDVSLSPISSIPTQGQAPAATEGQQCVEMQGDLNNALTQPQGQGQVNNAVVNSTLPTEPATVAPMHSGNATCQTVKTETTERPTATRQERKQAVIELRSKPQATVRATPTKPKPVAQVKPTVIAIAPTTTTKVPVVTAISKAIVEPEAIAAPTQATAPAPTAATTTTASAASGTKSAGNAGALKFAPPGHYALQLSSSSNCNSLNDWTKRENLRNCMVYQTTCSGQPWYVLVIDVYASKEDAKCVVFTLSVNTQAKNSWTKPSHQIRAGLR